MWRAYFGMSTKYGERIFGTLRNQVSQFGISPKLGVCDNVLHYYYLFGVSSKYVEEDIGDVYLTTNLVRCSY